MKQSKWWIVAFILAVVASAAGSLAYDSGIFRKSEKTAIVSDTVYSKHFNSARQLFKQGTRVVIGDCYPVDITFVATDDTVTISSPGRPTQGYKPLGVDSDMGLHALRADSAQVIFYKYKDRRDTTKSMIFMRQPETAMLFVELPTCPETEK